jgi:titin
LTLNWSAVADADAYEYSLDGGTTWSSDISSTSTTVSSLVNGTSYSVVVRALTLGVPGSASGPVTAAPLALPSTPATPLVAPGIGQLTISWAAADSAEQVDSYEYTTDGGLTWTPGTSGTTVSGLVFGIVYQVGVRSHNATGYSPASAYTPSLTLFPFVLPPPINPIPSLALPSAPATPTISVNSTTSALTITWAAANSAEQVDGYEYSTDGGITWTAGTSPTTISGLAAGVYTVVVRAHNATGYGPASTYAPALISSAPTPPIPPTPPTPPSTPTVTPPAAPSRPVVTSGQRSISISWPAVTAATSYEYSLNGGQSWSQPTTHRSVTVTGLQDGRTYSVKVRALTGSVTGAASAAVSVTTTPAAKPQPQPAVPSVQQRGSRGADVVRIQQLLGIAADGIFGPQTAAAVRGFQAAHHLQVDGIVGRQTWTALLGGSVTTTTSSSTRPWLQLGSTGNSVREAQQRLGGLVVDGIFGARTRSAVMAFQAKHHLQVDGIVGTQTWAALLAR